MKKITTLVLSLVLVLAMSITAFAATNNEVLDALKKAGVSGDYLTQAEAFLADNKLTDAELTAVKNHIDTAASVTVDVSFDAASNGITVKANGKTYSASSEPVKATGVSTTATVAGIAVLAMGLVACGVAVSKKRFA